MLVSYCQVADAQLRAATRGEALKDILYTCAGEEPGKE